ncbi:MAG TPA: PRC-barrel domain-containing protein [Gemmatimonadaceae bacterium]
MRLTRLEELKGFQVAEGDHDIRGWEVRTPDGNKIGKVEELIVDPAERRVRYMEVKVDHKALGFDNDRHILVPIGAARIKEDGKDVLIERLPAQGLAGAPPYTRGPITRDYETQLRHYYGATAAPTAGDYYKDDLYDDSRIRSHRLDDTMLGGARIGDNEVTLPLAADQEIVVRRPGSNEEIIIKKNSPGDASTRD